MSLKVPLESVEKFIPLIEEHLFITPKEKNSSFSKNARNTKKADPVKFFTINKKEGTINLPLYFARKILGLKNEKKYPSITKEKTELVLRENQEEFFKECVEIFVKNRFVTVKAYPGFGKTALCSLLGMIPGKVMLIYYHRINLEPQWLKSLLKVYPSLKNKIWVNGTPLPEDITQISVILSMIQRFDKIPPELGERIGTLILDESHALSTEGSVEALLHFQVQNIIVATATLERKDGMERMMHSLAGTESVFILNHSPFKLIKFSTGLVFQPGTNSVGIDYLGLCRLQSESEKRNALVAKIIKCNPEKKYIVLCKFKEHVETLHSLLLSEKIECDTLFGKKKDYSDSHVLIGSISKIGTGFDEENFCKDFQGKKSDVLILLTSIACKFNKKKFEETKNVSEFSLYEQVRGRIMRSDDPLIVYFVDHAPIIEAHFSGAGRLARYTGGIVEEFDCMVDGIENFKLVGLLEGEKRKKEENILDCE